MVVSRPPIYDAPYKQRLAVMAIRAAAFLHRNHLELA